LRSTEKSGLLKGQCLRGYAWYMRRPWVAIAHKLLVIVYHVLSTQQPYQEPKPSGPNALSRQKRIQRHLRELRVLGLEVLVSPISAQP
jgi:hypothetical protein